MTVLRIEGRPFVKGRARFGNGHAFTPKNTLIFEKKIAEAYLASGLPIHEGRVALIVDFHPTFLDLMIVPIEDEKSPLTGDVDNYLKAVSDGLNGIAYTDDKHVSIVIAGKGAGVSRTRSWAELLQPRNETCRPTRKGRKPVGAKKEGP